MSKSYFLLSSMIFFTVAVYSDEAVSEDLPSDEVSPELSAFFFNKKVPPKVNTVAPEPASISEATVPENKPAPENCPRSPYPMHAGVRHIEGKGIGYKKGYSTLELFFSPDVERYNTLPFADVRAHVFDDGKFALNAGFGFRYRTSCRTYGANVFYDFRETQHRNYNQIGAGFESLGTTWDFRLNGYLPLGKTESRWFHPKFDKFKGHYLYLKRKQEFAMRGADAEVGVHFLNNVKRWDLYTAAGPYYFEGKGKNAYGGKLRLGTKWKDFISLEASGSYDTIFHTIVQGQIGLYVPFGPRSEIKPKGCNCRDTRKLMERMVQPVARDEIIVVDKHHKSFVALDPSTGDPYFFWFVNNTSSSSGTFESPYPVLSTAMNASNPNDIIYIFPGDGTSNGLTGPFQLLDNQQFLGAGFSFTLPTQFGLISVPAQASGLPNLSSASNLINVANNNLISGLSLSITGGTGSCITAPAGMTTNNLTITNNLLNSLGGDAISFNGSLMLPNSAFFSGVLTISNNIITTQGGNGIDLASESAAVGSVTTSYLINDNLIFGTGSANGIVIGTPILNYNPLYFNITINNNTVNNFNIGVSFGDSNPIDGNILFAYSMQGNTITQFGQYGLVTDIGGNGSNGRLIIISNNFANSPFSTSDVVISTNSTCLRFLNNHSDKSMSNTVYYFSSVPGALFVEPLIGNVPEVEVSTNFTLVPANYCGN